MADKKAVDHLVDALDLERGAVLATSLSIGVIAEDETLSAREKAYVLGLHSAAMVVLVKIDEFVALLNAGARLDPKAN